MRNLLRYSLLVLTLPLVHSALAFTPEDCIKCHRERSTESKLQISLAEFKASVHGEETTCQECHTIVKDENHQTTPGSGVVDCSSCHDQQNRHGWGSKTGTRPQCYSCHTRHAILAKNDPLSSVHSQRLNQTCKSCHPRECGETDYLSWLPSLQIASHNKQDFNRAYNRDNCLGCHQGMAAHGEKGPINDQSCYRCHLTAEGQNKLLGYIHAKANLRRQPGVLAAATIYQAIMLVLVFGGLAYFIRKLADDKTPRN